MVSCDRPCRGRTPRREPTALWQFTERVRPARCRNGMAALPGGGLTPVNRSIDSAGCAVIVDHAEECAAVGEWRAAASQAYRGSQGSKKSAERSQMGLSINDGLSRTKHRRIWFCSLQTNPNPRRAPWEAGHGRNDGGWDMANGGWQMADGRWQMADGRWQMADGRWQMADGKWRMANGGWQMADGRWQMADGGWQMADGKWRMANGGWQMADDRWQMADGG